MKAVTQQDLNGCAIACVAFILKVSYKKALSLFVKGKKKATLKGFFCKEIISVLNKKGLNYKVLYLGNNRWKKAYQDWSIIFIKKSKKYPSGHYLVRYKGKWMDSWINFPYEKRKSGFRKKLPGEPHYLLMDFFKK